MSERNAALLSPLTKHDRILEIGPSFSPIAPRSAGWNTTTVDHDTQEGLIAKYRDAPHVDVSRIEPVDHVWRGGKLHELLPPDTRGGFRAVIASHVLEHLPDPLGFLASCAMLVDRDGMLLLALPDKRWCFDIFKPATTTGQWLAALDAAPTRHSGATLFDDLARAAVLGDRIGWGRETLAELRLMHPLETAIEAWQSERGAADRPYRDAHAWHFTPASFELLILESAAAGLCDWRVDWLAPQPAVEFLVRLRRGAAAFEPAEARDRRRLALLRTMLLELRELTDHLPELQPRVPPPVEPPVAPTPMHAAWHRRAMARLLRLP